MQAFDDRASRILLDDQRDELQVAAARAGQSIDVVDALLELAPVNTGRWFTNGGCGNVVGAMVAMQYGAGSLHRRASVGKVDDFTIRAAAEATAVAVVAAVAAAVGCAEQIPEASGGLVSLVAFRRDWRWPLVRSVRPHQRTSNEPHATRTASNFRLVESHGAGQAEVLPGDRQYAGARRKGFLTPGANGEHSSLRPGRDLELVGEFVERGISGTDDNRLEFRRMLEIYRPSSEVGTIIVTHGSRFMRNATMVRLNKETLRKRGIGVVAIQPAVSDDPNGHFAEGVFELIDQLESETNGVRTHALGWPRMRAKATLTARDRPSAFASRR